MYEGQETDPEVEEQQEAFVLEFDDPQLQLLADEITRIDKQQVITANGLMRNIEDGRQMQSRLKQIVKQFLTKGSSVSLSSKSTPQQTPESAKNDTTTEEVSYSKKELEALKLVYVDEIKQRVLEDIDIDDIEKADYFKALKDIKKTTKRWIIFLLIAFFISSAFHLQIVKTFAINVFDEYYNKKLDLKVKKGTKYICKGVQKEQIVEADVMIKGTMSKDYFNFIITSGGYDYKCSIKRVEIGY
jgi:predicted DNA-binding protein (UPF0251 family)